jgi:Flp pilus assembly protein CpaB
VGSRRTLILIAAIAVGAIASFLIWNYVGGIEERAEGDAQRVKVFVVKSQIVRGTYGEESRDQDLIVEDDAPQKFVPANAIRSLDDITGQVAINDLAPNQIVTSDMFAAPEVAQSTFAERLEKINNEDQTAITISVDQIRGVAHLLQPGDYVNILHTNVCEQNRVAEGSGDQGDEAAGDSGGQAQCPGDEVLFGKHARYILQKVQVLAIDQTPVQQAGDAEAPEGEDPESAEGSAENRGLVTLIVPTRAAQYVASMNPGNIYLTLVSDDYEPVPQTGIDPTDPLPGASAVERRAQRTPTKEASA